MLYILEECNLIISTGNENTNCNGTEWRENKFASTVLRGWQSLSAFPFRVAASPPPSPTCFSHTAGLGVFDYVERQNRKPGNARPPGGRHEHKNKENRETDTNKR